MTFHRRSILAAAALLLTQCQPAPAPATFSDSDRQGIQAVSDQWLRHMQSKSWDSLSQLYTEDAVFMPPNSPAVEGRAAIRDFLAAFPTVTQVNLTNDRIDGVGELAYVRGRYFMTIEGTAPDSGKFIEIRRKQPDGTWKMEADIFNTNVPMATSPAGPAKH